MEQFTANINLTHHTHHTHELRRILLLDRHSAGSHSAR
jgi:hypothetical protein